MHTLKDPNESEKNYLTFSCLWLCTTPVSLAPTTNTYLVNDLFEGGKLGKLLEIVISLHVANKYLVQMKIRRVTINGKPWAEFRLRVWIYVCLWVIPAPFADAPVFVVSIFRHNSTLAFSGLYSSRLHTKQIITMSATKEHPPGEPFSAEGCDKLDSPRKEKKASAAGKSCPKILITETGGSANGMEITHKQILIQTLRRNSAHGFRFIATLMTLTWTRSFLATCSGTIISRSLPSLPPSNKLLTRY